MGADSASTTAALSFPIMSFGVPLGAKIGQRWQARPVSARVGRSGASVERVSAVTAAKDASTMLRCPLRHERSPYR
jgi:hypothetical protein